MAIDLSQLNSKFEQLKAGTDLLNVESNVRALTKKADALTRTTESLPLQSIANKATADLQNLAKATNNVDTVINVTNDFPKILNGGKLTDTLRNATTALENLQNVMPELQKPIFELAEGGGLDVKIKVPIESFKSDLEAITEGSIVSGFNDLVVGLGTAAGIASSLKQVSASLETADISGVVEALGSQGVKDILSEVDDLLDINIQSEVFGEIGQEFKNLKGALESTLKNITNSPLLDAAHDLNRTLSVVGGDLGIPPVLANQVISTLRDGGVSATISLIGDKSRLPLAEVESKINEFSQTITNIKQIVNTPVSVSSTTPLSISSLKDEWRGGIFRYVKSSAQLKGDFVTSTREIDSLVVHWSETYLDQNIGAKELNSINNGGIPYHYVIRRDGSLQRGRDINQTGAHTESSVIDSKSIGVILIAGYPTYFGDESIGLSGDSITVQQTKTLETLMRVFYESFPGAEVFGHGELEGAPSEYEPGFDVKDFARSRFGKTRTNTNNSVVPPRIENTPVTKPSNTAGGAGKVVELYLRNGAIRDDPIQPDLKNILESVAQEANVTLYITSGGQLPNDPVGVAGGRTGGPRHDFGWAADMLAQDVNGKWLDFGTNNPSTKVLQIYNSLVSNGITGIGAGKGYMYSKAKSVHAIHVDIASGRSTNSAKGGRWGKDRTRGTAASYIT